MTQFNKTKYHMNDPDLILCLPVGPLHVYDLNIRLCIHIYMTQFNKTTYHMNDPDLIQGITLAMRIQLKMIKKSLARQLIPFPSFRSYIIEDPFKNV
jgi:hypothetical protein